MNETDQQKQLEKREEESPLYTDRGTTNIADRVVSQIVEMAVNEVQGIRPGKTNTQVGKYEVAVDFAMEVEFGRDLTNLTSAIRTRMSEQIWRMTGLRVIEQNITVTDIFFPKAEKEEEEREETEEDEQETREELTREREQTTQRETARQETGDDPEDDTEDTDREVVLNTERDDEKRVVLKPEGDTEREEDKREETEDGEDEEEPRVR